MADKLIHRIDLFISNGGTIYLVKEICSVFGDGRSVYVFSSSWEDGGGWGGECVSKIKLHNPQASSKANSIQLTLGGIKVSPFGTQVVQRGN